MRSSPTRPAGRSLPGGLRLCCCPSRVALHARICPESETRTQDAASEARENDDRREHDWHRLAAEPEAIARREMCADRSEHQDDDERRAERRGAAPEQERRSQQLREADRTAEQVG